MKTIVTFTLFCLAFYSTVEAKTDSYFPIQLGFFRAKNDKDDLEKQSARKIREQFSSLAQQSKNLLSGKTQSEIYTRIPSLFSEDDEIYDHYAACLAATEGLRRVRDREIAREIQRLKQWPGPLGLYGKISRANAEARVRSKYSKASKEVLGALGMSCKDFDSLGRKILEDDLLKQKVVEQAYIYRIAATVRMDIPTFSLKSTNQTPATLSTLKHNNRSKTKVNDFAESLLEIEKIRANQLERLQRSLQVEKLPENADITDPSLLPFLSPKVRAVVQAFPLQAADIVEKHGLDNFEFNNMLKKMSNPISRRRVENQVLREHDANSKLPQEEK